jgi:predicted dehydrogenase
MNESKPNRRQFLQQAGGIAATVAAGAGMARGEQSASTRPVGANDTIRLALIGCGGQGHFDLGLFLRQPSVVVPVVCDVDLHKAEAANRELLGSKAEVVQDYRHILHRKDIDAVLICTPEHWHAIQTVEACQAGKDVYCEKPASHNIIEGRRMVQAARRYDRVVQVGIQQQSGAHYAEVARLVREGKAGTVTQVHIWNVANLCPGLGFPPDEQPPSTLNWDLYLGPAPVVPYNPIRASGQHRLFWAFAGGSEIDWGTHHIGSVHHIMGVNRPLSATASGGKYVIKDLTETPDTFNAIWEYPGWTLEYTMRHTNRHCPEGNDYGILLYGTYAAIYVDRSGYEIYPEGNRIQAGKVGRPRDNSFMPASLSELHIRNFLDCVRSRQRPKADVEIGHRATTAAHLANISLRVGRRIQWDAEREQIVGDGEASKWLTREYRRPYVLPEV